MASGGVKIIENIFKPPCTADSKKVNLDSVRGALAIGWLQGKVKTIMKVDAVTS